ncbi:hypothetical protein TNCV_3200931 [Trichonephila clavipes]|nr:hypothetical protein TNCV_3200931 [Trichonephila clavipes]
MLILVISDPSPSHLTAEIDVRSNQGSESSQDTFYQAFIYWCSRSATLRGYLNLVVSISYVLIGGQSSDLAGQQRVSTALKQFGGIQNLLEYSRKIKCFAGSRNRPQEVINISLSF